MPVGENGEICIKVADGVMSFERASVAKVSTYFEF